MQERCDGKFSLHLLPVEEEIIILFSLIRLLYIPGLQDYKCKLESCVAQSCVTCSGKLLIAYLHNVC